MVEAGQACKICGKRRARRRCPGVDGGICTVCCGTEREVTVTCPLDCEYLQEARKHERVPMAAPRAYANADIEITEEFLHRNEPLLVLLSSAVARAALDDDRVFDHDAREALAGLVRTYRTLQSGLVYDSRPGNVLAARVFTAVQERVAEIRKHMSGHGGLRDADVLGILVFLERLEVEHNNGRPKGRAFLDFLRGFLPPEEPRKEAGSLIEMP